MQTITKAIHMNAKKEDIAPIVIMSGDPLRAKYIAETFLDDARLVNDVRAMYAFTGMYKGKRVTVMGHGMGIPSMGIYSYELYNFYDVDTIIRVGTCGNPLDPTTKLLDIVIADKAYSTSNFPYQLYRNRDEVIESDEITTKKLCGAATRLGINYRKGTIMTTEVFDFYTKGFDEYLKEIPEDIDILAAEMEAFALFHTARMCKKRAACIATVVDSNFTKDIVSIEDREKSLNDMIMIALESVHD